MSNQPVPAWVFLVARFVLYAGVLLAFILGAVSEEALDKLIGLALSFAAGASGLQALKGRPRKALPEG